MHLNPDCVALTICRFRWIFSCQDPNDSDGLLNCLGLLILMHRSTSTMVQRLAHLDSRVKGSTLILMVQIQVELVLKKRDTRSWALLEKTDRNVGVNFTFGVGGRTGTIGAKELVLDDQNKSRA